MENNNVILVVDDDTNILAIIEMYLKKEGYTVATCTRGDTAIDDSAALSPRLFCWMLCCRAWMAGPYLKSCAAKAPCPL